MSYGGGGGGSGGGSGSGSGGAAGGTAGGKGGSRAYKLKFMGNRGVFGGGNDGSYRDTIDYDSISTPQATATDFGDMQNASYKHSAHSSGHGGVTS